MFRPERATPADAVRPTRAEVNLANLRHNFHVVKRMAEGTPIWCVLKADGYGHGSKALARTLERAGADGICVALLEEGIELRLAGIRLPILVMGGHYGRAWGEVLDYQLTPVLHDQGQLEALAEEVRYRGTEPARAHVKVDTGMGRLGLTRAELASFAVCALDHPEVQLEGLMTHLACADQAAPEPTAEQLLHFERAAETFRDNGLSIPLRHAANSAALMAHPEARLALVRPGISLFGVEPFPGVCPGLRPVMRVRSEVIALRELEPGQSLGYGWTWTAKRKSRIATLPMGYADGLVRGLSNKGAVLVRGQRAPIVGVVSMDMTMVDVTDIEGADMGDECVVLGSQSGPNAEARISAEELAQRLGTIPWEILTNISRRVPRFYREP